MPSTKSKTPYTESGLHAIVGDSVGQLFEAQRDFETTVRDLVHGQDEAVVPDADDDALAERGRARRAPVGKQPRDVVGADAVRR